MQELRIEQCSSIYELYKKERFFFPLIASVLCNYQNGTVYVDDIRSPNQIYIQHSFGFSQIIGSKNNTFEEELKKYIIKDKVFTPEKIRLYATYLPDFLKGDKYKDMCSYRQRFILGPNSIALSNDLLNNMPAKLSIRNVDKSNINEIDNIFGVVTRFWRNASDFINHSNAIVAYYERNIAGICYSAAVAASRTEIDVLVQPEYRKLGIGKLTVAKYLKDCLDNSLQPLWDCFTNNKGSMNLCRSIGFIPLYSSYPFFTIAK